MLKREWGASSRLPPRAVTARSGAGFPSGRTASPSTRCQAGTVPVLPSKPLALFGLGSPSGLCSTSRLGRRVHGPVGPLFLYVFGDLNGLALSSLPRDETGPPSCLLPSEAHGRSRSTAATCFHAARAKLASITPVFRDGNTCCAKGPGPRHQPAPRNK